MKLNIEVTTKEQANDLIKQLQEMEFKKELPTSFEELESVIGFYIDYDSCITFATEKQAKSALSKAKLSQLMKVYNDGWEADWSDEDQEKLVIARYGRGLTGSYGSEYYHFLAFKDKETRDLFLERFEKDIRTYFELD